MNMKKWMMNNDVTTWDKGKFIKYIKEINMLVIYSQDKTYIRDDLDSAKETIIGLYGSKLGLEAVENLKGAREGYSFRKNGGPLIKVVSNDFAREIEKKESELGLLEK